MDKHCFRYATHKLFSPLDALVQTKPFPGQDDFYMLWEVCKFPGTLRTRRGASLRQYQSTIRNRHHRIADVCHKEAQRRLRKSLIGEALGFTNQALKDWSVNTEQFAPETARTSSLKAKILKAAGLPRWKTELCRWFGNVHNKNSSASDRSVTWYLAEVHFNELATSWSS